MRRWLLLALFVVLVVGGGSLIGILTLPGAWYASLAKPWFTPPNWLFAPAWTTLYVLVAIAGWRSFLRRRTDSAFAVWLAQMAANFAWSPVFFGLHAIGLGLVVILVLLGLILVFIAASWSRDRMSALLFLPYAGWVAFAALLNGGLLLLN